MLCLSGFELYSRWVPLKQANSSKENSKKYSQHHWKNNFHIFSQKYFYKLMGFLCRTISKNKLSKHSNLVKILLILLLNSESGPICNWDSKNPDFCICLGISNLFLWYLHKNTKQSIHFRQKLSSQNTRNDFSEHQDFRIFWRGHAWRLS